MARYADSHEVCQVMLPNTLPSSSSSGSGFDMEKQFSMQGGLGDESYALNSSMPGGIIEWSRDILMQALEKTELPAGSSNVLVADLGCSSGPNTLSVVSRIVNKLQQRYKLEGRPVPEFQAFFSDLLSNDFNSLFRILPPYVASQAILANDLTNRSYFAAGLPGSFYRRLFPSASLHTVFTANALHWLSKVPEAVQNKHSAAWNKGQSWISPSNKLAAQEYSKQAKEDLRSFLSYRAQEMASGSLLFVLIFGRASAHPEHQLSFLDTDNKDFLHEWIVEVDNCWNDLIQERVIEEEVRDSFNLPVYFRSVEEFEEAVRESSEFSVHFLKLLEMSAINLTEKGETQREEAVKATSTGWYEHARSVMGPLIEAHIGSSAISQLFFQRLKVRAAKYVKPVDINKASRNAILIVSLFRK